MAKRPSFGHQSDGLSRIGASQTPLSHQKRQPDNGVELTRLKPSVDRPTGMKPLMATLIFTLGTTGALATPTDDPIYDTAEAKLAIQCLYKANDARLERRIPFAEHYFRSTCAKEISAYVSTDADAKNQLTKTFDYFIWEDGVHHIR